MQMNDKEYTHIAVIDEKGNDYFCPVESADEQGRKDIDINMCFDRDVPGRYAARIIVKES